MSKSKKAASNGKPKTKKTTPAKSNGHPKPWSKYTKAQLWDEIEWLSKINQQAQELLQHFKNNSWQELVGRSEDRRTFQNELARLRNKKPKKRNTILKMFESMNFSTIAEELGKSEASVQRSYRRAAAEHKEERAAKAKAAADAEYVKALTARHEQRLTEWKRRPGETDECWIQRARELVRRWREEDKADNTECPQSAVHV